uniref:F-box domain-containing protein n=1 Tax=Strongyloides venezuelensis TaxID=75913 RepID=A0A0K0G3Z3_STRVS
MGEATLRQNGNFKGFAIAEISLQSTDAKEEVAALLKSDPKTSVRRLSAITGSSISTVWTALKAVKFHPYRMLRIQKLETRDYEKRRRFCMEDLKSIEEDSYHLINLMFPDEAHFHLDGGVNRYNCPYFFEGNVTRDFYFKLLQTQFWPEISDDGISEKAGLINFAIIASNKSLDNYIMDYNQSFFKVINQSIILKHIGSYLAVKDIFNFGMACKSTYLAINDIKHGYDSLWTRQDCFFYVTNSNNIENATIGLPSDSIDNNEDYEGEDMEHVNKLVKANNFDRNKVDELMIDIMIENCTLSVKTMEIVGRRLNNFMSVMDNLKRLNIFFWLPINGVRYIQNCIKEIRNDKISHLEIKYTSNLNYSRQIIPIKFNGKVLSGFTNLKKIKLDEYGINFKNMGINFIDMISKIPGFNFKITKLFPISNNNYTTEIRHQRSIMAYIKRKQIPLSLTIDFEAEFDEWLSRLNTSGLSFIKNLNLKITSYNELRKFTQFLPFMINLEKLKIYFKIDGTSLLEQYNFEGSQIYQYQLSKNLPKLKTIFFMYDLINDPTDIEVVDGREQFTEDDLENIKKTKDKFMKEVLLFLTSLPLIVKNLYLSGIAQFTNEIGEILNNYLPNLTFILLQNIRKTEKDSLKKFKNLKMCAVFTPIIINFPDSLKVFMIINNHDNIYSESKEFIENSTMDKENDNSLIYNFIQQKHVLKKLLSYLSIDDCYNFSLACKVFFLESKSVQKVGTIHFWDEFSCSFTVISPTFIEISSIKPEGRSFTDIPFNIKDIENLKIFIKGNCSSIDIMIATGRKVNEFLKKYCYVKKLNICFFPTSYTYCFIQYLFKEIKNCRITKLEISLTFTFIDTNHILPFTSEGRIFEGFSNLKELHFSDCDLEFETLNEIFFDNLSKLNNVILNFPLYGSFHKLQNDERDHQYTLISYIRQKKIPLSIPMTFNPDFENWLSYLSISGLHLIRHLTIDFDSIKDLRRLTHFLPFMKNIEKLMIHFDIQITFQFIFNLENDTNTYEYISFKNLKKLKTIFITSLPFQFPLNIPLHGDTLEEDRKSDMIEYFNKEIISFLASGPECVTNLYLSGIPEIVTTTTEILNNTFPNLNFLLLQGNKKIEKNCLLMFKKLKMFVSWIGDVLEIPNTVKICVIVNGHNNLYYSEEKFHECCRWYKNHLQFNKEYTVHGLFTSKIFFKEFKDFIDNKHRLLDIEYIHSLIFTL